MFFFDNTMILIIPVLILAFWAQSKVRSNFSKYSKIRSVSGLTGAEVAEQILKSNGIFDVQVLPEKGELTDHYNPSTKEVHLSEPIFYGSSVASISVAAHEVGHAIQHARGYYPVVLRSQILPAANLGSTMAFPLFIIGLIFSFPLLMDIGIVLFAAALAFHLVTLPVEFNASSRAIKQIRELGIVTDSGEIQGCKNMLSAAAMTYVASTLMALMQLIRLIILRGSRK
ncbi:MAG: zinc metallopeptidase [Candidatus Cloacimonadales bacterium]|jgi:Zn-dependent membrane protease YugP|nr:zinc metallopeptidase [Candidatus Cloacimonadota bacterium]MDD3502090.1 zinc metallopeptidase [Candidatus Cloacimonadota bacterium]MDX9976780.1 zinc metallopeptidase [Candidatus Cloacimonadales bacterium]